MSARGAAGAVVVIGLGRFGSSVARTLTAIGHEVLGIDEDLDLVQKMSEELTHVVQADATDPQALRRLGAGDMAHAVVGIGSDIEASILTVVALIDAGCPDIWAKAVNASHGRILQKVGARHVVYPEADMGERVAHQVSGRMIDFVEIGRGYAIATTRAPAAAAGQRVEKLQGTILQGLHLLGVRRTTEPFVPVSGDMVVGVADLLVIAGPVATLEQFAARN